VCSKGVSGEGGFIAGAPVVRAGRWPVTINPIGSRGEARRNTRRGGEEHEARPGGTDDRVAGLWLTASGRATSEKKMLTAEPAGKQGVHGWVRGYLGDCQVEERCDRNHRSRQDKFRKKVTEDRFSG
jgi:hypothetical protein